MASWRDRLTNVGDWLRALVSRPRVDDGASVAVEPGRGPNSDAVPHHERPDVPLHERSTAVPNIKMPTEPLPPAAVPAKPASAKPSRPKNDPQGFVPRSSPAQDTPPTDNSKRPTAPAARTPPGTPARLEPAPPTPRSEPTKADHKIQDVFRGVRPAATRPPVNINLGIDFGTSFTKVCYRDVGAEQSAVAVLGKHGDAMLPTVVAVSPQGKLYLGDEAPAKSRSTMIPYLKMRLAGEALGEPLPSLLGYDLNDPKSLRILSSWFLSAVILRSQEWIKKVDEERTRGRSIVWSANVGVPVEQYDSPVLSTFQEVIRVAWSWAKSGAIPVTIDQASSAYERALASPGNGVADFHAVPEIAAAVQSFISSRDARPGVYMYFDIGGGTVDGVGFHFTKRDGEPALNFYSAKVAPLGLVALGHDSQTAESEAGAIATFDREVRRRPKHNDFAQDLRRLVGHVVMVAKRKDNRDWRRTAIQDEFPDRKFIGDRDPKLLRPLIVFLGGGGATSRWYAETISSTHSRFQHDRNGVPHYGLVEVPVPKDLKMHGLDSTQFKRFAISYGLSIPIEELSAIRLPSQFSEPPPPPEWESSVGNYADSKDLT